MLLRSTYNNLIVGYERLMKAIILPNSALSFVLLITAVVVAFALKPGAGIG
jgi:hypothetical protein